MRYEPALDPATRDAIFDRAVWVSNSGPILTTESPSTMGGPMANDPSAKLRKLVGRDDEPIEDIVTRATHELGDLRERAIIELRLLDGEDPDSVSKFTVQLSHAGASLLKRNVENPTLLAITTVETFREMVNGSYSPFSARLDGKLDVRGNVEIALQIFRHLAEPGVQTPVLHPATPVNCLTLVNESYNPGTGSLTVTGENFHRGGTVDIIYNWFAGQYRRIVVADASGRFTVTEDFIPCGNNSAGVGVIVTATDLSSGLSITKDYSTPCG